MKIAEIIPINPVAEKEIETPVFAEELPAVNPVNDAIPLTALTDVVPPSVQELVPLIAVAVTLAVLVVTFPY